MCESTPNTTTEPQKQKQQLPKWLFGLPFVLAVFLLGWSSCVSPPEYPLEPVLEFVSLSTSTLTEGGSDTVILRIAFTDGDGDIGHGDPQIETDSTRNVFLEDSRVPGFPIYYHINEVERNGNVQAISGFIDLRFNPGFFACLGLAAQDTLSLSLYIIDRAGNQSNTVRTTPITLTCQ